MLHKINMKTVVTLVVMRLDRDLIQEVDLHSEDEEA